MRDPFVAAVPSENRLHCRRHSGPLRLLPTTLLPRPIYTYRKNMYFPTLYHTFNHISSNNNVQ